MLESSCSQFDEFFEGGERNSSRCSSEDGGELLRKAGDGGYLLFSVTCSKLML